MFKLIFKFKVWYLRKKNKVSSGKIWLQKGNERKSIIHINADEVSFLLRDTKNWKSFVESICTKKELRYIKVKAGWAEISFNKYVVKF